MKASRSVMSIMAALVFLFALSLSVVPQTAAADYEDGSYSVPVSVTGLGRHNILWSTAAVTVENGEIYADITFERVDPRDHAPQFDWLKTSLGTFSPEIDDASFTCTFRRVRIADFGSVDVTLQTSAMSQPYELEYTLQFDGSSVPVKAEPIVPDEPEPDESDDVPDDISAPTGTDDAPGEEDPAPAESEPPADADEEEAEQTPLPSPADENDSDENDSEQNDIDPDDSDEAVPADVPLLIMPAPSGSDAAEGDNLPDEPAAQDDPEIEGAETAEPGEDEAEVELSDGEQAKDAEAPDTAETEAETESPEDIDKADTDTGVSDGEKQAEPSGSDSSEPVTTIGAETASSGNKTVLYIIIAAVALAAVIAAVWAVSNSRKKKG